MSRSANQRIQGGLRCAKDEAVLKRSSKKSQPQDVNVIAAQIVEAATKAGKDPLAVELGRRGGLKGGKARAVKLTPERRREIARKAAAARWRGRHTS